MVHEQSHLAQQLDIAYTSYLVQSITKQLESTVYKLSSVKNLLDRNMHLVHILKQNTTKEMDHEEMANRLFDSMMKHGGPGSVGVAERPFYHPQDYITHYFAELCLSLEKRLNKYRAIIDDIERQVMSLDHAMSGLETMSPQTALEIIKNNYDTFLALAAKVAHIHDQLEGQKDIYMRFQRTQEQMETSELLPENDRRLGNSTASAIAASGQLENLLKRSTYSEMASRIAFKSQGPSGSALGISQAMAQPVGTGSMFGGSQTATGAPTSTFSLGLGSTLQTGATGAAPSTSFSVNSAPKPANTTTSSFGFGSNQPQNAPTATATTGGFGFGSQQAAPTSAPPTGSSFSFGGAQPTAAGSTGNSMFGQNQPAAAAPTASTFGQPAPAQPATSGFSFGGANTSNPPAPATGGFSFGGANTASSNAFGSSLFGKK
jgi:hypothetical protein